MSTNVHNLSPAKLADLPKKSKKSLVIQHRSTADTEPLIVDDGFPKDIGTTFSNFIRSSFPDVKTLSLSQLQQFREPSTITVTGSSRESVKRVIVWMRSACDGKGIKPYKEADHSPFLVAHHDRIAATKLQIPALITKIDSYIQGRLNIRHGGPTDTEVAGPSNIDAFFTYRPTTGEIPAHEISALLDIFQKQPNDDVYAVLVHYVADATWADMKVQYAQSNNSDASQGKVTEKKNRGGTASARIRYSSRQYVGIRNMHKDFGKAVDIEVEKHKAAHKAEKARARAEARVQVENQNWA